MFIIKDQKIPSVAEDLPEHLLTAGELAEKAKRSGKERRIAALQLHWYFALTPHEQTTPPDRYFPMIIDSGNNHNLSVCGDHLQQWLKRPIGDFQRVYQRGLPVGRSITDAHGATHRHPAYRGTLWIRTLPPSASPIRIELRGGFTFCEQNGPRLPLIGGLALRNANIVCLADYRRLVFSLIREPAIDLLGQFLVNRQLVKSEDVANAYAQQLQDAQADNNAALVAFFLDRWLGLRCRSRDLETTLQDLIAARGLLNHPARPTGVNHVRRLGEILVSNNVLTQETLQQALTQFDNLRK